MIRSSRPCRIRSSYRPTPLTTNTCQDATRLSHEPALPLRACTLTMTEPPDVFPEASTSAEPQKTAQAHELPTAHFYSIEYPGYVRPESVSTAVHSLGGQSSIDRAFRRSAPKEDALLELNLRPDNPFSHPLPGDLVPTNNILLKVVKRRLKRSPDDDGSQNEMIGEYTATAVGVIPRTARFRSERCPPTY